ncbi:MAG TPA: secondary thiamine-phosphate synthase enzyme YjbQ [Polyangiales bacterium]
MRQQQHAFSVETRGKGLYDISAQVRAALEGSGVVQGLCTVFIAHTSASLLIQENADVEVQRDLERFFARLVPDGDPLFKHVEEGPDDMPAHVRAALTQTSLSIPVRAGKLALGTWQGIYVFEHRNRPHTRSLITHVIGEG